MDLNPLFEVLLPVAVTILSGVASAVLALAYSWLRQKWGIEIEANDREALHRAIRSGIGLGVAKVGDKFTAPTLEIDNPITRIALAYVLKSVPDAIRRFDLSEERIEQMILAKFPEMERD